MPIQATTQYIIDAATDELGLPRQTLVAGLIDQIGTQSLALLNSCGSELVKAHDWQFLEGQATINGDGTTTEFTLPADFGRIVDQTQWSSNTNLPMEGPLNAQSWGWVQFGIVSAGVFFRYRILGNKFAVWPTPGASEVLRFYYIKKNWVLDQDAVTYKDITDDALDTPLFDRNLLIKCLKVKLWNQQGFDTTSLAKEYYDELTIEKAQSGSAPVLSLSSTRNRILLDPRRNIPDGDWN